VILVTTQNQQVIHLYLPSYSVLHPVKSLPFSVLQQPLFSSLLGSPYVPGASNLSSLPFTASFYFL
jgi:hypothetical protein